MEDAKVQKPLTEALFCGTKVMQLLRYLTLKLTLFVEGCLLVCTDNIFSSVKDNNYALKFWDNSKWKWNQGRVILEKIVIEFRVWIK